MTTNEAVLQYHLSEEQTQIRDVITAFLSDHYDHESRTKIVASSDRWSSEIWRAFAEDLGILGLGLPEAVGGLGGGALDHLLVMDVMGAALVVEPYLETCVLAADVLAKSTSPAATPLLEGIVAGHVRFAFAAQEKGARYSLSNLATQARRDDDGWSLSGAKAVVVGLPGATHLLVTARIASDGEGGGALGAFVVAADHPQLKILPGLAIDGRTAANVSFEDLRLPGEACLADGSTGASVIAGAVDKATAAVCAEAVGIMRRLISDTLGYLEQRKQFGVFLADFQVLQHRLADMQTDYEHAQALAYFAAGMVDVEWREREIAISAAKAEIATALRRVAQEAVQMHGAMGMTDELAIGHLFKRATALENQFGSVDFHMERVMRAGGDTSGLASN